MIRAAIQFGNKLEFDGFWILRQFKIFGIAIFRFKRLFNKMVKHTQTICRQIAWVWLTILWYRRLKG